MLQLAGLIKTEKATAPHSSTLAWKIPWTEEPGGLQPTGSQRVGHDWAANTFFLELIKVFCLFACIKWLLSPFSRVLLYEL